MAIQAYELDLPGSPSNHGIVLVNSVTDLAFPISVYTFSDLDDADAFLEWNLRLGVDIRRMSTEQLEERAAAWIDYGRASQQTHRLMAEDDS